MKLSILLPTHRNSLLACSRIAQACSWAGPEIEVIIRDNSGDARKRELLANFHRENCRIITVAPCDPNENFSETLRQATGDFVFILADDNSSFDHAIGYLPSVIAQIGADTSYVGITGIYAIERSKETSFVSYQGIESDEVSTRLATWLNFPGPNVLFYSALRRELVNRAFGVTNAMPFFFSFHDQILCLLFALNGKFFRLQRLMYLYDLGVWEVSESAQNRDLDFYRSAGLDPAMNKLHWLLCGFEGASLIMNSDSAATLSPAQRQPIADIWFSAMFTRFKRDIRLAFGSPLTQDADRLCQKLRDATGQLTFQKILAEIAGFIALSSQGGGQAYFDFWDAVNSGRLPPQRQATTARPVAVNEF